MKMSIFQFSDSLKLGSQLGRKNTKVHDRAPLEASLQRNAYKTGFSGRAG